LMAAIEDGVFAGISRTPDGGRGLDGVVERNPEYWNPFAEEIPARLTRGGRCSSCRK